MNLVDANILIYAYEPTSPQNPRAREWLEGALSSPEPTCFCWFTLMAFVRITTNPRSMATALAVQECCEIVTSWLEQPNAVMLSPGSGHWEILSELLVTSQAKGPLAMDAHLAALAIEHGATVVTADKDFTRFQGLKTFNPLEAEG